MYSQDGGKLPTPTAPICKQNIPGSDFDGLGRCPPAEWRTWERGESKSALTLIRQIAGSGYGVTKRDSMCFVRISDEVI